MDLADLSCRKELRFGEYFLYLVLTEVLITTTLSDSDVISDHGTQVATSLTELKLEKGRCTSIPCYKLTWKTQMHLLKCD